jgi:hypothetical protein
MTLEICSVSGLRSGIAAFMWGFILPRMDGIGGRPSGRPFGMDSATGRGVRQTERFGGQDGLSDHLGAASRARDRTAMFEAERPKEAAARRFLLP